MDWKLEKNAMSLSRKEEGWPIGDTPEFEVEVHMSIAISLKRIADAICAQEGNTKVDMESKPDEQKQKDLLDGYGGHYGY